MLLSQHQFNDVKIKNLRIFHFTISGFKIRNSAGPRNPVSKLSGWQLLRLTVTQFLALCGNQVPQNESTSPKEVFFLRRCLLRKLCKYTTRFGNFTWRHAPLWPPEMTTRSQSSKQGSESIFTKTHFLFRRWCQNQKYGHYAVNLIFSFQEPVRRKSYAEILNGDDEEDEKVDNSD